MQIKTVGDLRKAMNGYQDDVSLDIWLHGADRLESFEIFHETSDLDNGDEYMYPMWVLDFHKS